MYEGCLYTTHTLTCSLGLNNGNNGRSTGRVCVPSCSIVHNWLLHCISGVVMLSAVVSCAPTAPGAGRWARGDSGGGLVSMHVDVLACWVLAISLHGDGCGIGMGGGGVM